MTKETIIDGIDVSECKYYRGNEQLRSSRSRNCKEHPEDDCAISGHCEAYGDCDYKNLQLRKQFRNLQAQYNAVIEQNRQLQQELREKTAECEELKEQLEKNRKLTLEYISSGEKYLKALDNIENRIKNTSVKIVTRKFLNVLGAI